MINDLFDDLGLDDILDNDDDFTSDDGMADMNNLGNDIPDIIQEFDIDGDGIIDTVSQGYDYDNDGVLDEIISFSDVDSDGYIDTAFHMTDEDGDGISEEGFALSDNDGDGVIDDVVHMVDTDQDGSFDVIDGMTDDDDDSLDFDDDDNDDSLDFDDDDDDDPIDFDDDNNDDNDDPLDFDDDDNDDPLDDDDDNNDDPLDDDDDDDIVVDAGSVDTYTPYDDSVDDDFIVGDPDEAEDSWHVQESSDTCAVASQEFVLEMLTGEEFTEEQLRDIAEENGWYNPGGGTSPEDVGNILEYFGLDVQKSTENNISDIEKCLENDGQVIVAVDSSELWTGDNDDFYMPGVGEIGKADHAIQVVGIDRSDEDNPMVIINDSGVANGACAEIPLDLFMDAWEDSDCYMIEAYA